MTVVNEIRKGFYLDSVALMRISRSIVALPGIEEAGLMIGTPANKQILREAGVLDASGEAAAPGDLIIAVRAKSEAAAKAGLAEAALSLDAPRRSSAGSVWRPRTLRAAQAQMPDLSVALISVPGDFAAAEALKSIRAGLDVMIFSDNVPVEQEVELKMEARSLGRLVMGPDCGTAIIGGVPLAFANVVPRGDIGIIGASGTGIQEISCLIARAGRGVSHAIGTGGRDLKADVGGITTLMALDLLDADPATKHIVIVSKPPAAEVANAVLARVGKSSKPFTICFLGGDGKGLPSNAKAAVTLKNAAELAVGKALGNEAGAAGSAAQAKPAGRPGAKLLRGLYSGGTLCAEAQIVMQRHQLAVTSNVPVPGAKPLGKLSDSHALIDLGDDEFTRGRPHPMIEPAVRDAPLIEALGDPAVAVILLDIVLGYGGHADPAGHLAQVLETHAKSGGPSIIASVTGTSGDPQGLTAQTSALVAAGVTVCASNADAAQLAAEIVKN
jgi:FdrA protein